MRSRTCSLLDAPANIRDITNNICKVVKINQIKWMPYKTIWLDIRSSHGSCTVKFDHYNA
ncbi:hypothetical protein OROMI_002238 [Orobanche minor]